MEIPQLGEALFVPVINHADEKSFKEIVMDVRELAQKVRTVKSNLKRYKSKNIVTPDLLGER